MVAFIFVAASAHATTENRGAPEILPYKVNLASFQQEPTLLGESPLNAIRSAARRWVWSGGIRRDMAYAGTTTATECNPFWPNDNVIWASSQYKANDPAGTVAAYFAYCITSGFIITFYLPSANFTLDVGVAPGLDLEGILTHEFGHIHEWSEHTPDDDGVHCTMDPIAQGVSNKQFCRLEIDRGGAKNGHPDLKVWKRTSQGYPVPTTWGSPHDIQSYVGFGFADFASGYVCGAQSNRMAKASVRLPHDGDQCDVDFAEPCFTTGIPPHDPRRRPTLVYDSTRQRWWVFTHGTSETEIEYYVTWDFSQFEHSGKVSSDGRTISTRYPVGGAYDPVSDSIILAYSHSRQYAGDYGGCDQWGCNEALNVVRISAGAPGTSWSHHRVGEPVFGESHPGYRSTTPPAIACENNPAILQRCEIVFTEGFAQRPAYGVRVGFDSAGGFSHSAEYPLGVTTFDPMSIVDNGLNRTGVFMAAARLEDGRVAIATKATVSAAWSSWAPIVGDTAYTGPELIHDDCVQVYRLYYGR